MVSMRASGEYESYCMRGGVVCETILGAGGEYESYCMRGGVVCETILGANLWISPDGRMKVTHFSNPPICPSLPISMCRSFLNWPVGRKSVFGGAKMGAKMCIWYNCVM